MDPLRQHQFPIKFGKFELLEPIGSGGLTVVYRALLRGAGGFQREVVVKRVRDEFSANRQLVHTFLEEVKRAALLDHPNIAQVYDFGVIDGACFVSLEYIAGLTLLQLQARLAKRAVLPPQAVALIVFQVCTALAHIHGLTRKDTPLELLHRDVRPSNIMVSSHGEVKLLDFGLVQATSALDDERARRHALHGRWSHASPECVAGAPLSPQSDIFSLGIVCWELLVGRSLFGGRDEAQTQANVAQAKAPPPSSMRPGLPRVLDVICARALAKNAAHRFASAEAMAEQLWRYLGENSYSNADLRAFVIALPAEPSQVEHFEEPTTEPLGSPISPFIEGITDEGVTDEGVTDEGVTDEGVTDEGVIDEGVIDDRKTVPSLPAMADVELTSEEQRRRHSRVVLLAIALMLGAAIGLLAYRAHRETNRRRHQPVPSPGTPPARRDTAQVELQLRTNPSGAKIAFAGERQARGSAPLVLRVPRADQPVLLVATLPGYVSEAHLVTPNRDQTIAFTLKPLPATVPAINPEAQVGPRDAGTPP